MPDRVLNGYLAAPAGSPAPLPGVIVIHENRGLNGYIEDVARRLALAGFFTVAPDFLTPSGGTPTDEDAARKAIAALDPARTIADAVATIDWLRRSPRTTGKIGIIGFCWGGGLVDRVAAAAGARLNAAVAFYGPPPDPAAASRVKAPIMLHYAGLDTRIDTDAGPWVKALKAAGVDVRAFVYPNVDHAFHNDTSAARYNAAAATLAWDRTIAFLRETLIPPAAVPAPGAPAEALAHDNFATEIYRILRTAAYRGPPNGGPGRLGVGASGAGNANDHQGYVAGMKQAGRADRRGTDEL